MRSLIALSAILLLSACSALQTTPQPPPPPAGHAQEIVRAQTASLTRLGTASVTVRGSPDDAERALADKANASGASYYLIQLVSETVAPGMWYASAIFYGPSTHTAGAQ